jgi:hypothetical protein
LCIWYKAQGVAEKWQSRDSQWLGWKHLRQFSGCLVIMYVGMYV